MYFIYATKAANRSRIAAKGRVSRHRVSWTQVGLRAGVKARFLGEEGKAVFSASSENMEDEFPKTGTSANTNPLLFLERWRAGENCSWTGVQSS